MLIPITKDECFYNFKCLRPMSGLLPFNSVLSNISYVGAGFNAPSSPSCLAHASLLSPSCLSLITCLSLLTLSCLTLVSLLSLTYHLSFTLDSFDWTFTGVLFLVCVSLRNLKRRKVLEGFPSSTTKLG